MKSVKQWLETIADEEIRKKALSDYASWPIREGKTAGDLPTAIDCIDWECTETGFDQYEALYNSALSGTIKTIP